MAFHEVSLPQAISYGSEGGPGWNTSIVQTSSGAEERVTYWDRPKYSFDVSFELRDLTDIDSLVAFCNARRGSTYGFRFKDPWDFTSATDNRSTPADTDVQIGIGDASETTFQLVKLYTDAGGTTTRPIEKPVSGTVVISLDNVNTTAFSVDTTTGIVTMNSAPGSNVVVRAGYQYDVPVRFGEGTEKAFRAAYDAFETGSLVSVELIEDHSNTQLQEEFFFGGSALVTMTGNYSMAVLEARFYDFDTNGSNREARLPDQTNLPLGGPYFYVYNRGAQTLEIRDKDATLIASLATTQSRTILLGLDSSGNKTWKAI